MRLLGSLESIEMWAQAKVSLSSITWYMTLSKLLIPLNHHVKDEDDSSWFHGTIQRFLRQSNAPVGQAEIHSLQSLHSNGNP